MITLEDILIMARTIYGEARGENYQTKKAVAHVILNRTGRSQADHNPSAVCLRAWQFSAWNTNDPNRDKLLNVGVEDSVFRKCMRAALDAIGEQEHDLDPTAGSDHYHTTSMPEKPYWARGVEPTRKIGALSFYNLYG